MNLKLPVGGLMSELLNHSLSWFIQEQDKWNIDSLKMLRNRKQLFGEKQQKDNIVSKMKHNINWTVVKITFAIVLIFGKSSACSHDIGKLYHIEI